MSKFNTSKRQLRKHFLTINPGHVVTDGDETDIREWWATLKQSLDCGHAPSCIRWLSAALEPYEDGTGAHAHIFVELTSPKRGNTVAKALGLDSASCTEVRNRQDCRDYTTGEGAHADKPAHDRLEYGTWRVDASTERSTLADTCVDAIVNGATPEMVARHHPKAYFTHHRSVRALYDALGGYYIADIMAASLPKGGE